MRRRTRWIVALGVGIPAVLIAAAAIALLLFSSDPQVVLSSIDLRPLPEGWSAAADVAPGSSESVVTQPPAVEPQAHIALPRSGTLVMQGSGKPFGEEAYELTADGDGVLLRSSGKFWFKALIATLTVDFEQTLRLDAKLRPLSLVSSFKAPLGFGRDLEATFESGEVRVQSGEDLRTYPIDPDRCLAIGTFSSYAVIPLLFELRNLSGAERFDSLAFGGPPGSSESEEDHALPQVTIRRGQDGLLRADGRDVAVERYEVSGDSGVLTLYVRGGELLGLSAGQGEESLDVYRADYFPAGFEVVR